MGLCYQDDYLWPYLSAKEHLKLFAGICGVDSVKLEDTVQKWLKSVDLDSVQQQYVNTYSGGMKRRLSVALATIGDRPLIVLDEPTTGMDPVRYKTCEEWRMIKLSQTHHSSLTARIVEGLFGDILMPSKKDVSSY